MEKQSKSRLKSFASGFVKPSLLIIILALILASLIIFSLENFISSGKILNIPRNYVLSNSEDYSADLSYTVIEEKFNETDNYRIYMIGGSATRKSIVSDEYFNDKLYETYGEGYEFIMLSTSMLSILDTLLIADNLPADNGAVVACLNIRKPLIYGTINRYLVKSDKYVDYINENKIIDNFDMFDKRAYKMTSGRLVKKVMDRLFLSPSISDIFSTHRVIEYKEDYGKRLNKADFEVKVNLDIRNLETGISSEREELFRSILVDITLICEEKGLDFVLLDGPYNIEVFSEDLLNDESGTLVN